MINFCVFLQVNLRGTYKDLTGCARDVLIYLTNYLERNSGALEQSVCSELQEKMATQLAFGLSLRQYELPSDSICTSEGGSDDKTILQHCSSLGDLLSEVASSISFNLPYGNHAFFLSWEWPSVLLAVCFNVDISNLVSKLSSLCERVKGSAEQGQFEWVDNVLVKALEQGHWLLISHANFCR